MLGKHKSNYEFTTIKPKSSVLFERKTRGLLFLSTAGRDAIENNILYLWNSKNSILRQMTTRDYVVYENGWWGQGGEGWGWGCKRRTRCIKCFLIKCKVLILPAGYRLIFGYFNTGLRGCRANLWHLHIPRATVCWLSVEFLLYPQAPSHIRMYTRVRVVTGTLPYVSRSARFICIYITCTVTEAPL